jgi:Ca2+-binding EF-hand superfamily protein
MMAQGGAPARLFISPMGEPFRTERGQGDPEDLWFKGADTNGDGKLSPDEFAHDAARFFAVLDRGHDGEIDPDDIEYYETVLVPEIRVSGSDGPSRGGRSGGGGGGGGRHGGGGGMGGGGMGGGGMGGGGMGGGGMGGGGRGGSQQADDSSSSKPQERAPGRQGAARYSYLDYPEPVTAADTNMNRGVSPDEFDQAATKRFALLDKNGDGFLERDELPSVSGVSRMGPGRPPQAPQQ